MINENKLLSSKVNSAIYFNNSQPENLDKNVIINKNIYSNEHINNVCYKKVITMTAYKRPEYTKEVIENLKKCIGFDEYLLLPVIDPGYPNVLKVFEGLSNCNILLNKNRSGLNTSTYQALRRGFDISEFVIHIEDDTVPGIDVLKYFEWAYKTYKEDKEIFTISSYNKIPNIDDQKLFTCFRKKWFTPWLWGTWIDRFNEMLKNWNFKSSWDTTFNKRVRNNRYEIYPYVPRTQNIGKFDGANNSPKHWLNEQYNKVWINDVKTLNTNGEFKEVT